MIIIFLNVTIILDKNNHSIMKKLIIISQPSSKWFTHQIANKYKIISESLWDKVKVLDLYDKNHYQPYLEFEDMKILWNDPNREKMQEKILWADELVFIFPVWWGNMPAIMKNFIDTNFSAWFAYKFRKWKATPKKLLKWKTSKIFTTCDWNAFIYNNVFCPMYLEQYLKTYILWVFGVEVTDYTLISKMRKRTDIEKNGILNEIEAKLKAEKMKFSFSKMVKKILKK